MEKNDRRRPPQPPGRPHPRGRSSCRPFLVQPTIRPDVFEHLAQSFVSDAIRRTPKSDWKPRKITGIHRVLPRVACKSFPGDRGFHLADDDLPPPLPRRRHTCTHEHMVTWPLEFSLSDKSMSIQGRIRVIKSNK